MEKLNVKPSKYKHKLSYNEWAREFRVGSGYVEQPKLYQGNPSCGIRPIGVAKVINESPFERFVRILFNKITK